MYSDPGDRDLNCGNIRLESRTRIKNKESDEAMINIYRLFIFCRLV